MAEYEYETERVSGAAPRHVLSMTVQEAEMECEKALREIRRFIEQEAGERPFRAVAFVALYADEPDMAQFLGAGETLEAFEVGLAFMEQHSVVVP